MVFAVFRTARYVEEREEVEVGEVSVFISRRFVITVRQGEASDLHGARMRLEERPELLKEGTAAVLWAILDTIVDDYAPVIEGLERDVEEVERPCSAAPPRRPSGSTCCAARRQISIARSILCSAPLEALERGTYLDVSEELRQFFRDVNDHLKLVNEEVIALRDVLATILQANMAVISNQQNEISVRQNETMKQLTLVATIFLPLTFITGFFGMNFGWMIDDITSFWVFAVYGVGSLVRIGRRHLLVVPPQRRHIGLRRRRDGALVDEPGRARRPGPKSRGSGCLEQIESGQELLAPLLVGVHGRGHLGLRERRRRSRPARPSQGSVGGGDQAEPLDDVLLGLGSGGRGGRVMGELRLQRVEIPDLVLQSVGELESGLRISLKPVCDRGFVLDDLRGEAVERLLDRGIARLRDRDRATENRT